MDRSPSSNNTGATDAEMSESARFSAMSEDVASGVVDMEALSQGGLAPVRPSGSDLLAAFAY